MKRIIQTALLLLIVITAYGQMPLPYSTGWDNGAQMWNWKKYRKGHTSGTSEWTTSTIAPAAIPSPPNCIMHDYPVGGAPTPVVDWYVSPRLNLSRGGEITNLQILVYAISGSTDPDDHFGVYLLRGDSDPASATQTLLADLTGWASSATNWVNAATIPINIPATTGATYIGFKYSAKNNWFVPYMDDLYISRISTPPPPGSCDTITSMSVYNITHNSAQIKWDQVDGAIAYEFAYDQIEKEPTTAKSTTLLSQNAVDLESDKRYYVYVRSQCNATDFSEWRYTSFVTRKTTSIKQTENSHLKIYPNPGRDRVTIEGLNAGATLLVTDVTGRNIYNIQANSTTVEVPLVNWAAGMYFLKVSDNNETTVHQFVKE
jgi:hypothetical protein